LRLLCIDFGLKFVGVAVADFPGITARALDTIRADKVAPLSVIARLCRDEGIGKILIGFPFSDVEGEIHHNIRAFRAELEATLPGMPIEFVDESYSSQEAEQLMASSGLGRKKKTRAQDSEAAKLVLLRYLRAHDGESFF